MTNNHDKSIHRKLKLSIIANFAFTVFELIIGVISGSLALISDGIMNLADALSLSITFIARKIAEKYPTDRYTFGFGRVTVLAAFINASFLFGFGLYILTEAYHRLYHVQPVEGGLVMIVGFFGVLVNGIAAMFIVRHRDDLNIKSAFFQMAFDALASAGALLSGIIIYTTGYTIADPLISLIISVLLLITALSIYWEVLLVFLESVPARLNLKTIKKAILDFNGVKHIKDLHVWEISSKDIWLMCKIDLTDKIGHDTDKINMLLKEIKQKMHTEFRIKNTNIEVKFLEDINS